MLRKGGRLLVMEFSPVNTPGLQQLYDAYSFNIIPALGHFVAHDRESYQYLVESIRQFPVQVRMIPIMPIPMTMHLLSVMPLPSSAPSLLRSPPPPPPPVPS